MDHLTVLECSACGKKHPADQIWSRCECGGPLLAQYDLDALRESWPRESLADAPADMWRYAPVLPAASDHILSLGEGWTPVFRARKLAERLGLASLWIKEEGVNPTGSGRARGVSCAMSMCRQLGIRKIAIASAGNAGGAVAAYAAAAGMEAHVFLPLYAPQANYLECMAAGARVTLVDGSVEQCERLIREGKEVEGWFDVSELSEPYRVEGDKTAGYELAEQLDWTVPDVIIYPGRAKAGLVGIWKAFAEMEAIGWIGPERPRMIAAEGASYAELSRAFETDPVENDLVPDGSESPEGLQSPSDSNQETARLFKNELTLSAIRASGGCAVAVPDRSCTDGALEMTSAEGIFCAPETGACVAVVPRLIAAGRLRPDEQIVIFNTATGLKYTEAFGVRYARIHSGQADRLGGLITPR